VRLWVGAAELPLNTAGGSLLRYARSLHGTAEGEQSMRTSAVATALASVLLTAAAVSQQPHAAAQPAAATLPAMSAGDLQQLCTGTDHVSRNACRIYILGVTQGIAVGLQIAERPVHGTRRPCTPSDISAEALERAVKERLAEDLEKNPARRDADASAFIATVLARVYPCHIPRAH
jgi:hypothetical protein